uniref:G_PROTEIN_RECEP_F1_2 domain-containing protein n=1 Tax=Strongyloides stercoralis TaxID=6248 RepID=A0A0K0EKD8_STRER
MNEFIDGSGRNDNDDNKNIINFHENNQDIIITDNVEINYNFSINSNPPSDCSFVPPVYVEERFWLVTVAGTIIAIICIIENAFLFSMLARKRKYRNSYALYLLLLALFDILIGIAYIPLMSLSLYLDYIQSVILLRAWYAYMIPMITVSHIAMTSTTFLIVAASWERYCITASNTKMVRFLNKYRKNIAGGAVVLGMLTKISLAFEFDIKFVPRCVNTMAEYELNSSSLALSYYYALFWRLIFRNIFTILAPFFFLLIINARVVYILHQYPTTIINPFPTDTSLIINDIDKNSSNPKLSYEYQRKIKVRAATKTLLFVALSYILSNFLNVILTLWEYIDIELLQYEYLSFYTITVDLISIFTVLVGALRLPIYVACMPEMRIEFRNYFHKMFNPKEYDEMLMVKKKPGFLKKFIHNQYKSPNIFIGMGEMWLLRPMGKDNHGEVSSDEGDSLTPSLHYINDNEYIKDSYFELSKVATPISIKISSSNLFDNKNTTDNLKNESYHSISSVNKDSHNFNEIFL